ncbi:hypothetical protein GHT09_017121 [Marmota monax]|uniref:Uncharacterized protein n=1 Tax=Marmota monax TaxID=9995 RepID=A0A834UVN8_MARMO|nr:hypothetical protein GHT09_017121 [Marmota monax]
MVPVCGGILSAAESDAAPARCGSEFKSGLLPMEHDKDLGRIELPIAEPCLGGHRVGGCAGCGEPPGTGSTHRRWTGKIHTVGLGFAPKYEELCCADTAQSPQAQAPELAASRVLPRSLGVLFHRVLQGGRGSRGARPPVRAAEIGGGGHVGGHVLPRAPSKRKWGLV